MTVSPVSAHKNVITVKLGFNNLVDRMFYSVDSIQPPFMAISFFARWAHVQIGHCGHLTTFCP